MADDREAAASSHLAARGGVGDLRSLIEAEASLHRYGEDGRVIVNAPPLGLDNPGFGVVALVLHEMMTNAAKYGALSVSDGLLTVRWQLEESGDCVLTWTESGGPPVSPPIRFGFGSKLINSTVQYDLGATVAIHYALTGLEARFVIPRAHLREGTEISAAPAPVVPPREPLAGRSILLVRTRP